MERDRDDSLSLFFPRAQTRHSRTHQHTPQQNNNKSNNCNNNAKRSFTFSVFRFFCFFPFILRCCSCYSLLLLFFFKFVLCIRVVYFFDSKFLVFYLRFVFVIRLKKKILSYHCFNNYTKHTDYGNRHTRTYRSRYIYI